ncbi:unnamed protein product [Strongylus vulgaris]|uniref:C2H2-type domain-containing protein n=1 Tax=Strongylus vulgaris TaxID=40348 RepID=A0A3P7K3W1_STRVU|nr:unnamed protein product [Strongylus vulgaris]
MADSEQKARRKLEEAEKKCRGGGGFLGKLFGGSGADDAADLFIQSNIVSSAGPEARSVAVGTSNTEVDNNSSESDSHSIECDLCSRDFPNLVEFESHYKEAHSHQCTACARMFISKKALDIHSDETHCPFHSLSVERDPSGYHFKCYEQNCDEAFTSAIERDQHCHKLHNISNVEVTIEKRKLARRVNDLQFSFKTMKVSKKKKVPHSIRFGNQVKSFAGFQSTVAIRSRKFDADISQK